MKQKWKKPYVSKKKKAAAAPRKRVAKKYTTSQGNSIVPFASASQSSFSLIRKKPRYVLDKGSVPRQWLRNIGDTLTGDYSQQTPRTVVKLWSGADLKNVITQCQNITVTGPALGVPQTAGVIQPVRVLVESVTAELRFHNHSNSTQYLDLYMCASKRDQQVEVVPGSLNPETAWASGMTTQTTSVPPSGVSPDTSVAIGCVPSDSQLFKDYFKVVQRRRLMLTPGANHSYHIKYSPYKVVDGTLLSGYSNNGNIAGLTMTLMAVLVGQPTVQTTTEPPSTNIVATQGLITWYSTERMSFRLASVAASPTMYLQNNIIGGGPGATPDTLYNPGNGLVEDAVTF